ncbi:aldo keto reductase [Moniliophthora roreri]|nr:aldo keto reductase [Moniliophthora roreri]
MKEHKDSTTLAERFVWQEALLKSDSLEDFVIRPTLSIAGLQIAILRVYDQLCLERLKLWAAGDYDDNS